MAKASLPAGMTLLDFASPARIMKAFDNDMKAIRAEYSRERSINRKRVERMREAGETYNPYYKHYGEKFDKVMPSARELTDQELLRALSVAAHGIGGGYLSTVKDIRESRTDTIEALKLQAEDDEDEELLAALSKKPTAKQMADVGKMMGMIERTVGKLMDSGTVYQEAIKSVMNGKKGESLLTKTARVMQELGIDTDETGEQDNLERLKSMHTQKGDLRASYKKSRQKRGG